MEIALNPLEIGFMHRAAKRIGYRPKTKFIPLAEVRVEKITETFSVPVYRGMKAKKRRIPIIVPGAGLGSGDFGVIPSATLVYSRSQRNVIPHVQVLHQKGYFNR